jgi:CheY-like chemotaxis protein/HPt (histidine-containing phosphotransfer) domain-containing protein
MGLHATIACNGRDAVAAIRNERFDLILMDYHMPELDGCDATAEIRRYEEDHRLERTPIVAVTASVLKEDKERCLSSGMDDFLPKPIRQRTLAAVLDKWLPQEAHNAVAKAVEPTADETLLRDWSHLPREYFDLEQLLEMRSIAGETFNALVEQFHGSAGEILGKLHAAIDGDDSVTLRRAAHKLKGAATTLGIRKLSEQCYALELIGKENRMGAASECLAALEKEYVKVRRYMDACTTDLLPPAA